MTAAGPSFTAVTLIVVVTGVLAMSKLSFTVQVIVRAGLAPPLVGSSLVEENVTDCSTCW